MSATGIIPGVAVPVSLLSRPQGFGGQRQGDCLTGDLLLRGGRVQGLRPGAAPTRLVMPKPAEVHCHLDKCHSIDRILASGTRPGGGLRHAITAQATDTAHWTLTDLHTRIGRGLADYAVAGAGVVRSHVDWHHPGAALPPAWAVLRDLAPAQPFTVQMAALCGIDMLAEPGLADAIARAIAPDGGVLGAFVLDQPHRRAGLRAAFAAADRHGLALDFHVDEGLAPGLDGLRLIVETAEETGFQGPILCGHGCALSLMPADDLARLADRMARAGIALAVLPATNLFLQGRAATPAPRGLAPLHALRARGVRVVIGTDNVRDAFLPLGRHDPLWALSLAALAAHLDAPMGQWLPMVTSEARAALGLPPVTVDGAALADLVVYDAASPTDLLTGAPPPRALQPMMMETTA